MNTQNKTLCIKNLDSWVDYKYVSHFLNELKIYPNKIIIKSKNNKKKIALLEFDSYKSANNIFKKFNGIKYKNINIKLNWIKKQDNKKSNNTNKYTVSLKFYIYLQLYVGNLDKSITEEELKLFFQERYSSIVKVTIIKDKLTNKSKGYAFIEFTNIKEFHKILNNKIPILLKKQKLIINCGKNKYDIQDNKIETKTIEHSESSTNISQTNENNSSCENTTFSFLNNQEIKPNIENFFKKERNDEDIDTINFSKGFKSVSQICKNLNSKVYQLSQCNYYCNLIFSNLSYNNINKDLFLYNGFYNNYNQFCPNNQFYKYYTLKPFNFSYIKYDNSLYS